jgi:phosphatidylserine synthase
MILFLIALVLAAAGVGIYAHYNTGVQDITLRTYHFAGVPDYVPVAAAAGVVLFFFLIQAISSSIRIRMARRRAASRFPTTASSRTAQSTNR